MTMNMVTLPSTGQSVVLVPRDQLRAPPAARRAKAPGLGAGPPPAPPSWSPRSAMPLINFPMLGNDQAGDCFYAAICHLIQEWTGSVGTQQQYDTSTVLDYYYRLSGGDNGLSNDQAMPELLRGPCGLPPHAEDWIVLPDNDPLFLSAIGYETVGLIFTLAVPDAWIQSARPGAVWDATRGVRPNPRNGHAVILSGRKDAKGWDLETWGFDEPVYLTDAGVRVCDPEFLGAVGRPAIKDGRNWTGRKASEVASSWRTIGGKAVDLGPDGPGPGPGPTPDDVVVKAGSYLLDLAGDATFRKVTGSHSVETMTAAIKSWSLADLLALLQAIIAILQGLQADPRVMTGGVKGKGGDGPHPVQILGGGGRQ